MKIVCAGYLVREADAVFGIDDKFLFQSLLKLDDFWWIDEIRENQDYFCQGTSAVHGGSCINKNWQEQPKGHIKGGVRKERSSNNNKEAYNK